MPGRNGQGPTGAGPLTGRGFGPCGGTRAYGGRFFGRGACFGAGRGMRMGGFYNGYYPANEFSAEEEKEIMLRRKEYLEKELSTLQKNIDEL